jgi:hypothetical protein
VVSEVTAGEGAASMHGVGGQQGRGRREAGKGQHGSRQYATGQKDSRNKRRYTE